MTIRAFQRSDTIDESDISKPKTGLGGRSEKTDNYLYAHEE